MKATSNFMQSTAAISEPMQYVDQSVYDLSVTLLSAPDLTNEFHIVEEHNISTDKFQAEIAIIGSSHTIKFSCVSGKWQEVLACLPFDMETRKFLVHRQVVAEGALNKNIALNLMEDNLTYHFRSKLTELSGDLFRQAASTRIQKDGMFATFPGEGEILPFTGLVWKIHENGIIADSIHAYPGNAVAVLSRSIFSIGKPSPEKRDMFFEFGESQSKSEMQRN